MGWSFNMGGGGLTDAYFNNERGGIFTISVRLLSEISIVPLSVKGPEVIQ